MPEDHPQNSFQYINFNENFNPPLRGNIYKIVSHSPYADLLSAKEKNIRKSSKGSAASVASLRNIN